MKQSDKSCQNCHHGIVVDIDSPCNGQGGCFYDKTKPGWKPMTNGDKMRRMSNEDLAARLLAYQGKKVSYGDILAWLESEAEE